MQTKEQALDLMHEAHKVLLREMDRICTKNNLTFFLEGGSLLGAIRHHDAIPWDDDTDTVMFRKDFEKFRKVVKNELSHDFLFVEPDEYGKNVVYDHVSRLVMKDSIVKKDSPEEQYYGNGLHNHVVLDIFIMDDVPDNDLLWSLKKAAIFLVYGLGMAHRYPLNYSDYKGLSKLGVIILSKVGKLVKAKTIFRWYSKVSQWGNGKNKKKNRCFSGNNPPEYIPLVYQKKWFAQVERAAYGEDQFPIPSGYHEILSKLYGNYMEFPPEESRKLTHCQVGYVKVWNKEVLKKFPEEKEYE